MIQMKVAVCYYKLKKKFRGLLELLEYTAQPQDVSCTVLCAHVCCYSVRNTAAHVQWNETAH